MMQELSVKNGKINVKTDSFSVFYYDENAKIYGTGDADVATNPANLSGVNDDDGKYYYVNRGDSIYFYGGSNKSVSDNTALSTPIDTGYRTGLLNMYRVWCVTVNEGAGFYNQGYKIKIYGSRPGRTPRNHPERTEDIPP